MALDKNNWTVARLGDVCGIVSGFAFDSKFFNDSVGMPLIRIRDVGKNRTETFFDGDFQERFLIKKGDFLIAMDGEFRIAEWNSEDALLNQRVCKIFSSSPHLDSRFLLRFLPVELKKIEDRTPFVTVKHLSVKEINEIPIPLPPHPTQQKIAAALDQADAVRRLARAAVAAHDDLVRGVFLEMFGDPVRNEKGWEVRKLGELCEKIQIGPFGTQLHFEDYIVGGIPLVNPSHIVNGLIQPDLKLTVSKEKHQTLSDYWMAENDIVIGRRGEMGRCAIVSKKEIGWLCGTGSLFLKLGKNLNPVFAKHTLSHESMKKKLEQSSLGTTMSNLNSKIVNDLVFPAPPISKQTRFAQILTQIEHQKALAQAQQAASEAVFSGLLSEVFG